MKETIQTVNHVTGSLSPTGPNVKQEAAAAEEYGVIILPPILDETNEELDKYPQDYLEYSLSRMKQYKEAHGDLPAWKRKEDNENEQEAQ